MTCQKLAFFFLFEHNLSLLPKGNHYSESNHQGFALFLLFFIILSKYAFLNSRQYNMFITSQLHYVL